MIADSHPERIERALPRRSEFAFRLAGERTAPRCRGADETQLVPFRRQ